MKKLLSYKILTYILIPFGALFGIISLFAFLLALSNPPMLLGVFLIICCVLYIFSSFSFLNRVIVHQQKPKKSFKDFIKVNAFVTIGFTVLSISGGIVELSNHQNMVQIAEQFQSVYKNNLSVTVSQDYIINMLKGTYTFIITLCFVLLIHVLITLRLLKLFAQSFQ